MTLLLLFTSAAHADNNAGKLHDLEQKLVEQKAQQAALAKKMADAKDDLAGTQNGLVKLAASIRANEQELSALDTRMADLSKQDAELTQKLETDYGSISGLVLALERIRRIPPESLIARPGAPLQTAQSAMLLEGILPAVNARAEDVSAELRHLAQIRQSLADDRAKSAETGADLKKQYADMQDMLGRRKALFATTRSDYRESQKAVERMSQDADNLRDLMAKLAEEDRRQAEQAAAQRRPAKALPSAGIPNLPVAGAILTAYGGKDAIGATSEGIRVGTRPGAIVTAPMGGIVKFAGEFRNYGQLVIIEHEGDYHSLIGGLGRISVAVGQSIKSGEPLGNMKGGGASSTEATTLYYELRHHGRPIDPATKLRNLRS
jgi:septal ring factor EnvC (AmiA/AmiB activator)